MQFRQQFTKPLQPGRSFADYLPILAFAALICGSTAPSDAIADSTAPPADAIIIAPADLARWREQAFVGHTLYRAEEGSQGRVLHATADASASALCQNVRLDLGAFPIVRWSWRLDRPPSRTSESGGERGRDGDDQGLRLSFLHLGGATPDAILAIQYIWSQDEPVGATWPNAFAPNARELVARNGPALPGVWQAERRNLREDFRAAFGRDVEGIDAVCVMTDGDQTGALVEGWYGDIEFKRP